MTPHDEVVSGLNYIGRNVAQQDALRLRMVHALESLVIAVGMAGFGIVMMLGFIASQIAVAP